MIQTSWVRNLFVCMVDCYDSNLHNYIILFHGTIAIMYSVQHIIATDNHNCTICTCHAQMPTKNSDCLGGSESVAQWQSLHFFKSFIIYGYSVSTVALIFSTLYTHGIAAVYEACTICTFNLHHPVHCTLKHAMQICVHTYYVRTCVQCTLYSLYTMYNEFQFQKFCTIMIIFQ